MLISVYEETKKVVILKYFIIHFSPKFVFDDNVIERIFNYYTIDNINITVICNIYCNKLLSCNISMNSTYINLISNKILESVKYDQTLFIEGCTLMAEILMKFHSEEVQDKFFESVLSNFKALFSSKTFDKKVFSKLEYFLCSIIRKMHNSSNILSIENFLIFIDNFQRDVKLNICNTILRQVILEDGKKINDPYLAYVLLKIIKYIHDCLLFNRKILEESKDSKNLNIEKTEVFKEVESIIVLLINKLDFGFDYESYFNFLCEIRSNIYEMQNVIERTIIEVLKICYNTYNILKGKNSKKTLRFIKVCVAFCQITIPSIKNKEKRIHLFLETSSVALTNNLISEADSIIKNAINLINEIFSENKINLNSKSTNDLLNQIKKMISLLVVIPGNPDSPFQLFQGITNLFGSTEKYEKEIEKLIFVLYVYMESAKYLTTQLQISFPYHIINVDSNDEIFCGEVGYMDEGSNFINFLVNECLNSIEYLDKKLDILKKEKIIVDYINFLDEFIYCLPRFCKVTKNSKPFLLKLEELYENVVKNK